MGIQGLLPLLKSIMVPIQIKDLEGLSVAIDTYSWLHKGALCCSKELCKGQSTSKHIDYCMHRVNLLRHYGVKPVLVFDGGLLPMKGDQENKRARTRKENLARAMEHESNGNSAAAYECYQKAVDISTSVANDLIQVLKQENVSYVVAPYEADAQMTFLAISKQVDAVITEDSDLIAFGCPRIIYKMDKFGHGFEFRHSRIEQNKDLNFAGFTKQMLLEMCILSGCDYLQSLPGMGLKKAHALMKKFKSYDKVIKHLKYSTVAVSPSYEESFKKAIMTFQHQRVYDPTIEDIVHLSDLFDDTSDDLEFLGPSLPQHIAQGIARGDLDPFTKLPFQGRDVSSGPVPDKTYHVNDFKPEGERKKIDLPAQKNLLTNYFCFASLEAKRKFMAPRITPKHPNLTDEASKSDRSFSEDAGSENLGNLFPAKEIVDDTAAESHEFWDQPRCGLEVEKDFVSDTRSPEHALLQQPEHSIHRPCITLHKDLERKTRKENVKVSVRSSYFQHKSAKDNDQEKENENLLVKGNFVSETSEIIAPELESKPVSDARDGRTNVKNGKVIVRSRFFQHKLVTENHHESNNETLQVKENVDDDTCEDTDRCNASSRDKSFEGTKMKRKVPPIESFQMEKVSYKCKRKIASPPIQSNYTSNLDDTAEEGKFGCNISHLGHYSDIAEKSLENYVSVISSFRYSSSGSRASGLRAPLRDVRNTSTNRSTEAVDLSKFAYVPTKRKTSSASRRG